MPKLLIICLLILASLNSCNNVQTAESYQAKRYDILSTDTLPKHVIVSSYIEGYRQQLSSEMNEIIGHASQLMYRGKPESLLTNFVADLLIKNSLEYSATISKDIKPDISLVNVYGFRNSIPEGAITRGVIYEVMPFDNRIVYSYLRGDKLRKLCKVIASHGGEGISGMKMVIKEDKLKSTEIRGKPLDDTTLYCVITSDYLADGGGGLSTLKQADKIVRTEVLLRDAIMEEVLLLRIENKSVSAKLDKRIYVE